MHDTIRNQRGSILVIFALALVALIGFAALGIEVGQWYITQAELSKAVDAASLSAAANIANTNLNIPALADDFGAANFQPGYLDTPGSGAGTVAFTATTASGGIVTVTGQTNAAALLATVFGIKNVAVSSIGVAQRNKVQIMLVLDRSGSMAGTPEKDLQTGAKAFISYYENTQATDEIGLVTFSTTATVDYALGTDFYTPILNAINAMQANNYTTTEDALAQAGAQFPDQTLVPPINRIQQYIVFFTDGNANGFRSTFTSNGGKPQDAILHSTSNCDSNGETLYTDVNPPQGETGTMFYPDNHGIGTPQNVVEIPSATLMATPTGDGLPVGTTKCKAGKQKSPSKINTNWGTFTTYPISGLGTVSYPTYCSSNTSTLLSLLNGQNGYVCTTARQMAIDNVNALKARYVQVYVVGYGSQINSTFLGELATDSNYLFITPDSSQLQSILSQIAKDISLRLIQ